ncbi:hypothetical protein MKQ70_19815 [Chitinophaga sedimenti]|uniref:hypothetical protein n=1 Tax=Chitinophaga sedimenti TaxID=2033606 RepID=UPI0020046B88|nr:hypothetical protein [Chitinophaga sedimenti]MCK7557128.1 hypothetical protein [Chitinophaga sedimenti]
MPDDFWEHWKDPHGHPGTATVIKNPSFEKSINFDNPAPVEPWLKLAYLPASAIYEWGAHIGRNNTGGVSLESGDGVLNDIAIGQDIALDPSKFYELQGWIKTADVRDGTGANICLYGTGQQVPLSPVPQIGRRSKSIFRQDQPISPSHADLVTGEGQYLGKRGLMTFPWWK